MWVRPFQARDLSEIFDIAAETLNEIYDPQFLIDLHSYWPDGFLVFEERGEIMGFIAGMLMSRQHARILMLSVREKRRRRGYASTLCREFMKVCGMMGVRMITLEVRMTNEPAISFYHKLGFSTVMTIDGYYTDGEVAKKMQLIL